MKGKTGVKKNRRCAGDGQADCAAAGVRGSGASKRRATRTANGLMTSAEIDRLDRKFTKEHAAKESRCLTKTDTLWVIGHLLDLVASKANHAASDSVFVAHGLDIKTGLGYSLTVYRRDR